MTGLQNGLSIIHFRHGIAPSGTSSVRFSFLVAGRPSALTPSPWQCPSLPFILAEDLPPLNPLRVSPTELCSFPGQRRLGGRLSLLSGPRFRCLLWSCQACHQPAHSIPHSPLFQRNRSSSKWRKGRVSPFPLSFLRVKVSIPASFPPQITFLSVLFEVFILILIWCHWGETCVEAGREDQASPELEPLRGGPGVTCPWWVSPLPQGQGYPQGSGRAVWLGAALGVMELTSGSLLIFQAGALFPKTSGLGTLLPFNQDLRACTD